MKCPECGRYTITDRCAYCEAGLPKLEPPPRRSVLDGPREFPTLRWRYEDETPAERKRLAAIPAAPKPKRFRRRRPKPVVVRVETAKARRPSYVIPAVERTGLLCPCGETEPMRTEVGFWLDDGQQLTLVRNPAGELLWYRCASCGSITRETLLPAVV